MEDLQKEFIPYDRALKMKALGFDEPCFAQFYKHPTQEKEEFRLFQDCVWENRTTSYWRTNISSHFVSVPTFSQAFRFFREKYFYLSYVCAPYKEYNDFHFRIRHIGDVLNDGELESYESEVYKSYEEAELACLDKLLEIVKSKQKEDGK